MTELSYDQLIQEAIAAKQEQDQGLWRLSAIVFFLRDKLRVPGKTIAGDIGCSASHVSNLVQTFEAFPEESDRASDMSFSIHHVCASTDNPANWLDKAVSNAYSVRQLKQVIKGEAVEPDPHDVVDKLMEKVNAILDRHDTVSEYMYEQLLSILLPAGESIVSEAEAQEEAPSRESASYPML